MIMSSIRGKYGPILVGGIIGFIVFVFVFTGIFTPDSAQSPAVAGTVNGDRITVSEFNREFNRRVDFFKNLGGGKISEAQLKQFRIREGVFQELVNRKIMIQEAKRAGLVASDEEVKDKVKEIEAFQKDGKFDLPTYRKVLQANGYSAGGFEKMLREDISAQLWSEYFRKRAQVSDQEIEREFLASKDKRSLRYVVLTSEVGRKNVKVAKEDVEKFLKDEKKVNLAKNQYEVRKERDFKDQPFDAVKAQIAEQILAGEKTDEIKKNNDQVAEQVAAVLKADAGSESKVNDLLKQYGVKVQNSGMISRLNAGLPGLGDAKEILSDAFSKGSPIDPAQGGKAKKYSGTGWSAVAVVTGSEKPDLAKLDAEKDAIRGRLQMRKQRELQETFMKKAMADADIERNESIVGGET